MENNFFLKKMSIEDIKKLITIAEREINRRKTQDFGKIKEKINNLLKECMNMGYYFIDYDGSFIRKIEDLNIEYVEEIEIDI